MRSNLHLSSIYQHTHECDENQCYWSFFKPGVFGLSNETDVIYYFTKFIALILLLATDFRGLRMSSHCSLLLMGCKMRTHTHSKICMEIPNILGQAWHLRQSVNLQTKAELVWFSPTSVQMSRSACVRVCMGLRKCGWAEVFSILHSQVSNH